MRTPTPRLGRCRRIVQFRKPRGEACLRGLHLHIIFKGVEAHVTAGYVPERRADMAFQVLEAASALFPGEAYFHAKLRTNNQVLPAVDVPNQELHSGH